MRKAISFLISVILLLAVISPASALSLPNQTGKAYPIESVEVRNLNKIIPYNAGAKEEGQPIEEKELRNLTSLLEQNGFGGKEFSAYLLRNSEDEENYLLGFSENGYIIVERDNSGFCECGEGNPYQGYEEQFLYYGGPLCYYCSSISPKDNYGAHHPFFDILRGVNCDSITTLEKQRSKERGSTAFNLRQEASQDPVYLPNNYNYIRRKAFGYNDDNTCSAVATEIAIDYIALHENMKIIEDDKLPEPLNDGNASSASYVMQKYPKAYSLHRYIADTCGMGAASFSGAITSAIGTYSNNCIKSLLSFPDNYKYGFSASAWILPASDTIRSNIADGKPVLITTTAAGDYSWHTMCVYGHRTVDGEDQLLVHTGWYSRNSQVSGNSNQYIQNILWIDEDYATWGYYFSYENPLSAFTDIPSFTNYTYPGILFCVHNGIMSGTSATTFSPSVSLNRAMFVQMLYRMAGSPSVSGYPNPFTDVSSSSYYYNAVRWAYHFGIVAGTSPTTFSPNNVLQRQQLAVILYAYASYEGKDTSHLASISSIPDWSSVASWARTAVRWAIAEGILVPEYYTSGNYLPQADATRSQTAYGVYQYEK